MRFPFEAWMEVDMRSADVKSLDAVNAKFKAALNEAVDEENKRWNNRGPVSVSPEMVGLRPAGNTPANAPIVQTALAVSKALGASGRVGRRLDGFERAHEYGHSRDHDRRRRKGLRRAFTQR